MQLVGERVAAIAQPPEQAVNIKHMIRAKERMVQIGRRRRAVVLATADRGARAIVVRHQQVAGCVALREDHPAALGVDRDLAGGRAILPVGQAGGDDLPGGDGLAGAAVEAYAFARPVVVGDLPAERATADRGG